MGTKALELRSESVWEHDAQSLHLYFDVIVTLSDAENSPSHCLNFGLACPRN
jgi:hypothetical protein